jgi:protein-tyrosine phosphatase
MESYRGRLSASERSIDSIQNNVKAVVCCAELYDLFRDDFEYLHVPMESNDEFDITASCVTAWNWIDKKLQNGSVLVHCNAGCHRSATVTIGYLAKRLKMTVNESYRHVRSKRHCVHIDNFIPQLELLVSQSQGQA